MKKSFCIFFLAPILSFAQTTEEEYNYASKGYFAQVIEQGGDVKKGYAVNDLSSPEKVDRYTFQLKSLVRESTKELAALILIAKSSGWTGDITKTFCLPLANETLISKYQSEIHMDTDLARGIAKFSSKQLGLLAQKIK